jgi:multiple sugar transport system ATP-binding protein
VARFIGSPAMNLHDVAVREGAADLRGYSIPLPPGVEAGLDAADKGRITLGFRPEAVEIVTSEEDGLDVTAEVVEELGSDAYLFASLTGHERVSEVGDVVARIDPRNVPQKGATVRIRIRREEVHLFSPSTGSRLN